MKKFFAFVFFLSLFNQLNAQQRFTVQGKINNYSGKVYLYYDKKDSVYTKDGTFLFKGKLGIPALSYISVPFHQRVEPMSFWIDAGQTILQLDTASFKNNRFSGLAVKGKVIKAGHAHQVIDSVRKQFSKIMRSPITDDEKKKNIRQGVSELLRQYPNSIISLSILSGYKEYFENKELQQVYASLSPALKTTSYALVIKNNDIKPVDIVVGQPIANFEQNNQFGKPVSVSDFKGKYLLVDFWASWCVPCRQENPTVVKAYQQYKNRGFEVLSVSLDDDKKAWVKAIKADGLKWVHVSDLGGWQNAVSRMFNIQGIPTNILIDKNGIVLAKDLRGEDLEKKLSEIFGKTK
ncbi:TlpA disulfide reductase family protein [Pedobacter sp. KR3-3]|uniref:TlpA disulfide reductase family protein n=1 Tax=Pedobacter albus TaxID=3113905 RepID=A0ABU7I7W1_9SPHI|nr:TlpA disulfide reductase family protein [Pedobacter sp. KR3-3]MEE1945554.1 TlpA disulfide reductase family protein [Pedobacter sp. KR3-3]